MARVAAAERLEVVVTPVGVVYVGEWGTPSVVVSNLGGRITCGRMALLSNYGHLPELVALQG